MDKVHDLIPCPLLLATYKDNPEDAFPLAFSIRDLVEKSNELFETQIDSETTGYYIDCLEMDAPFESDYFKIFIGHEMVMQGSFDEFNDGDFMLQRCVESVLKHYHEKIYEQQLRNQKVLEKLEREECYEFLYEYSKLHNKDRALFFLKKCASQNSRYRKTLARIYKGRRLKDSYHPTLARKMKNEASPDYYCF